MPIPAPLIPAMISGGVQLAQGIGNFFAQRHQVKEQRREYDKMRDWNSPKAQMERFRDAGLSPYLAYGQASSGNVSSPAPAQAVIPEKIQGGLSEYISAMNFSEDIKAKRLNNAILANEVNRSHWRNINEAISTDRKSLELLSDFPDFSFTEHRKSGTYWQSDADSGFRKRLNEVKLATSQALLDKVRAVTQGVSADNIVKGVKAHYASEYGMVGGDWTQGLGLLKSLPSFFKSRAKTAAVRPSYLKLGNYRSPQTTFK